MNPFRILGNTLRRGRTGVFVVVCLAGVSFGAGRIPAQDLGALARQEQARKNAEPSHASHVYTNDDLARPQILVPEDRQEFAVTRGKVVSTPEAPETDKQLDVAPTVTPTVSLGEIARSNGEQKPAKHQQSPSIAKAEAAVPHVYTNDEMTRPTILTPRDQVLFEAALKKAAPSIKESRGEIVSNEPAEPEKPLGDLARAAYQRGKSEIAKRAPSKFHLPNLWAALASPRAALPTPPPARPVTPKAGKSVRDKGRSSIPANLDRSTQPRRRPEQLAKSDLKTVTVQSGDSLWKLARRHLGRGSHWRVLLSANPEIRDPNHLKIGTTIRV